MSETSMAREAFEKIAEGAGALANELGRRRAATVTDRDSFEAFLEYTGEIGAAYFSVVDPYLDEWERLILSGHAMVKK